MLSCISYYKRYEKTFSPSISDLLYIRLILWSGSSRNHIFTRYANFQESILVKKRKYRLNNLYLLLYMQICVYSLEEESWTTMNSTFILRKLTFWFFSHLTVSLCVYWFVLQFCHSFTVNLGAMFYIISKDVLKTNKFG